MSSSTGCRTPPGAFSKDSVVISGTGSTGLVLTITGDENDGGSISGNPSDGVITLPGGLTGFITHYDGHTFSADASVLTGTIAADGSLALKLYYTNNILTNPTGRLHARCRR